MNTELVVRPATTRQTSVVRRGIALVLHAAWRLVIAAAPVCDLYWIVGVPPAGSR
ncbi:MAG: hypothetical protein ACREN2_01835 [Candidatus Dormibacteria bacterium]